LLGTESFRTTTKQTVEDFRRSLTLTLPSDFLVYFSVKVEMQQAIDMFEA
jgi:hypothetical protein